MLEKTYRNAEEKLYQAGFKREAKAYELETREEECEYYPLDFMRLKKYYRLLGRMEVVRKIERYEELSKLWACYFQKPLAKHSCRRNKEKNELMLLNYSHKIEPKPKTKKWEKEIVERFKNSGYGEIILQQKLRALFDYPEPYSWLMNVRREMNKERGLIRNQLEEIFLESITELEVN